MSHKNPILTVFMQFDEYPQGYLMEFGITRRIIKWSGNCCPKYFAHLNKCRNQGAVGHQLVIVEAYPLETRVYVVLSLLHSLRTNLQLVQEV